MMTPPLPSPFPLLRHFRQTNKHIHIYLFSVVRKREHGQAKDSYVVGHKNVFAYIDERGSSETLYFFSMDDVEQTSNE